MLETKMLEIRDKDKFIPALAVQMASAVMSTITESAIDAFLLRHSKFDISSPVVVLIRLEDMTAECQSIAWDYAWEGRTMEAAHGYIQEHFSELPYGAVVDVEYILGETSEPCASKRTTAEDAIRELR